MNPQNFNPLLVSRNQVQQLIFARTFLQSAQIFWGLVFQVVKFYFIFSFADVSFPTYNLNKLNMYIIYMYLHVVYF